MATKKKTAGDVVPRTITTLQGMQDAIKGIGDLQREKSEVEDSYNAKIQALQKELTEKVTPLDQAIESLALGIKAFSDGNRKELLPGTLKSREFPTGSISYRSGQDSVPTKMTAKLLDQILSRNGLEEFYEKTQKKFAKFFLRMKVELDKEAILQDPKKAKQLAGVQVEQGKERFYIKPATVDTETEVNAA